ncbi:MAG: dihydrodipicolinate synthase family protein [Pirellulales bacterium]
MTDSDLYPLQGIVAVLNTPLTASDQLDVASLRRGVDAAIDAGVAGLLVPAMAAEVDKLSIEERRTMVGTVMEQTAGRVPVIGGAGGDASHRSAVVRDLLELDCDGILLQIAYENQRQYHQAVCEIADLGPKMIMLQDWASDGYGLPVPLICRLFDEVDAFRCLKVEVVPAGVKYTEVLQATSGRLHVSGGWAVSQMIEGLQRGVHAFMPTGMHEIYTTIYCHFQQGRPAAARQLFHRLLPVLAFSNQHLDISIHFFKRLLHRQGIFATPRVREPILPFDTIHEQMADELIEVVLALTEQVLSEEG